MPFGIKPLSVGRLLSITCFFWLVAKLISYKVWLTSRLFPVVPVLDSLSGIPAWIHTVLYFFSLSTLLWLIARPANKAVIGLLFFTELASVILDYTRWQPWEYQYLFILIIFFINRNDKSRHVAITFLLAVMYIYSGIQKLNPGFLTQVWNNMVLMSFLKIPHQVRINPFIHYSGYIVVAIEAVAGLGLLFRNTRKPAVLSLIAIHIFNLIWLGPVGANYNTIIWPWNVLMIIFLLAVIYSEHEFTLKALFKYNHALLVIFWGIAPMLNFFGLWDHYLSFSLYSGKLPLMAFCVDKMQSELKPYIKSADPNHFCDGKSLVKIQSWAMAELHVPPYPEKRVYKKLGKILHSQYPGSEAYLYYYIEPNKKYNID